MRRTRAVIAAAATSLLGLTVVGCTPEQVMWHVHMKDKIAAEADPVKKADLQQTMDEVDFTWNAEQSTVPHGYSCPEWYSTARDAGFSLEQWRYPVSFIMWRESRCDPGARNSNGGAAGLMQEMPMWADDCGGIYASLFNPSFNLMCAFHIYQVQGWEAWSTFGQ